MFQKVSQIKTANSHFKKVFLAAVLSLTFVVGTFYSFTTTTNAAIPKYINFQGKLTAVSGGTNVANGTYAFEFKLYDALTSGSLLWTETFDQPSGSCGKLTVTNGVFNAKLGSCASLASVDFTGGSVFLSVNFAPTGTSYDGEMSPRKQLVSSAFAFVANGVSGDGAVNTANSSATALTVAKAGTDYALQVDTSAGSAVTGLKVTSAAAAGGLALTTLSTATDESLSLNAKGAGQLSIGSTSTGNINIGSSGTGDILLGGGSASTGCTVTNSTGAFACSAGGTFTTLGLSGAITGATGITSSGTIQFSALTSNGPLYTSAGNGTLTTTAPTSGAIGYWSRTGTVLSQTTANDTISLTGNAGDIITVASSATGSANKALNVSQTGGTTGTDYAGYFSNTGSATTNIAGYFTASGATNNYAAIFDAGNVGIGDTTPAALFTVGSGDLFQVNSSGTVTTTSTINAMGSTPNALYGFNNTQSGSLTTGTIGYNASLLKTGGTGTLLGVSADLTYRATATSSFMMGGSFTTNTSTTGGVTPVITTAGGVQGVVNNVSGATITTAYSGYFSTVNSGTGTMHRGIYIEGGQLGGTLGTYNAIDINNYAIGGTLSTLKGINMSGWSSGGTVTTSYGIYMDTSIDIGSTRYAMYSSSTSNSYMAGNLGLGDISPAALLTVGNGDLFQVNSSGAIAAATGILSSGTIRFSSLTSNGPLYTSAGDGTLTTTAPTSGAIGYWSRSSTTISPTTANDIILQATTNTTGADLGITNTGVYIGTGIFNLTANSATTGTLASITGNGLTTGSLLSLSSSSAAATTGQKGLNVALTGALTGAQTTYGGYFSNTRTGASAVNVGLYATASGATGANYAAIFDAGNVGIGTLIPAAKLTVDSNSNSSAVRLFGATEASEIADIYVQSGGRIVIDTTAGSSTSGFIDLKGEDDEYGLVLRDSSGVSSGWANFYMNDVATDYLNVCLNCTNAGVTGLVVQDGGRVAVGTTAPDKALEINSSTGANLRLTYNDANGSAANYADFSMSSGGTLTIDSSSGRTGLATGDFFNTSVSGVSGAAAGDIWYDTAANKYKINENGTTKILCNTTDAGCGSGGSTTWDTIGDAAGNGAVNMGTTTQTLDWGATTTTDNLTVTSSATGLTSGSAFKVTSATTGAVTNGIVQLLGSANFSGSGGLLNVTANSTTAGTVAKISGTGLTTGTGLSIVGGTAMTTGSDLDINGATYTHTGNETGSLAKFLFTDATISAVTSTTNGISIAPTINAPSGAATRTINGLSVTPTFTNCAAGTCTVNGVDIGNVVDGTGFTGTGLSVGSGWDAGLKFFESNPANGTNYAAISAPASITASYNWTLPSADAAGCLKSDGAGALSIATCGDTNNQSFSNSGNSTYSLPAGALMVIVETFGSGGGGGGGSGSANVTASRSGGGGGGGGSYVTSTFSATTLGTPGSTTVEIRVGAGGTGGGGGTNAAGTRGNPGNPSCFSTAANCTGTVYVRAFGGGGGGPGSVTANTGAGGGGGGGSEAVGTNSTSGTGGAGGAPQGSAANTANSGSGGGGGGTSTNAAAVGGAAHFGGAGGGSSSLNGSANGAAGGGSVIGGSAGGAGGGSPITTCALKAGGNGGTGQSISGGGGLGGTTTGAAGANGAAGVGGGGDGGGGGANGCATTGGAGGAGGLKGGGGGGGGYGNPTGGTGGTGGDGYVRVWTYKGQGADLAEIYGTNDASLTAGDVVAIDSTMRAGVKKSTKSYDNTTIGVISTSPGLVIGNVEDPGATPVMVALAGRVPVKVNMENGAIKKGDYLTPSSIPGEAMKSIKAGLVIGQAMTDYTDSTAPGIVVAFIKSGPTNGSKLADILPDGLVGGFANPETVNQTIQQRALALFSSGRAILEKSVDISEIFTDRLTAGLEVITPTLYANNVNIDTIHSMTGESIGLILNSGGKFTIGGERIVTNADGTKTITPTDPVITFDSDGNASFTGEITADAISANKIDGIENLGDRLVALESQITTTAQQVALDALTARVSSLENPVSVDLNNQNISGSLSVNGSTTALAGLVTNNISALGGLINLMSDVEFIGRPYFNTDTAGFALIRAGERSVNITFDQEYLEQPIVSATITVEDDPRLKTETDQTNIDGINLLKELNIQNMFNADIRFLVVNKSERGFTIMLKEPAQQDVIFSWVALMVKGARTFSSLTTQTPTEVISPIDSNPVDEVAPSEDVVIPSETPPTDANTGETPPIETLASDPPVGPPAPDPTPETP